MGTTLTKAKAYLRTYQTDGVPSSGQNNPAKADGISVFSDADSRLGALEAGQYAGVVYYATLAALSADLAHGPGSGAEVFADGTPANNGVYSKVGASGSGSWTKISSLAISVLQAQQVTDEGLITANTNAISAEATARANADISILTQLAATTAEYLLPAESGFIQATVDEAGNVIGGTQISGLRFDFLEQEGGLSYISYIKGDGHLYVSSQTQTDVKITGGAYASCGGFEQAGSILKYIGVTAGGAREYRSINLTPKVALDPTITEVYGIPSTGQSHTVAFHLGERLLFLLESCPPCQRPSSPVFVRAAFHFHSEFGALVT